MKLKFNCFISQLIPLITKGKDLKYFTKKKQREKKILSDQKSLIIDVYDISFNNIAILIITIGSSYYPKNSLSV